MQSNSADSPNVLVIEDDPDLNKTIVAYLNLSGFDADGVLTVSELREWQVNKTADLFVVDLGLSDGDGFTLVEGFRSSGRQGIVIMTARHETEDKLRGYASGADHYLVKPVDLRELVVVLRAVFDRLYLNRPVWSLREIECRLISPEGVSVRLTRSEYKVLRILATRPGLAVSRAEVAETLGLKYDEFLLARLEIMIRRLRGKIREAIQGDSPIETVRSLGYAFAAPIRIT